MHTRQQLQERYPEGTIVSCVVTRVEPFGVFVHLEEDPSVPGFIHRHDWSWSRRVFDLTQSVEPGEHHEAYVLEPKKDELRLSRRRAIPDPYQAFRLEHVVGDAVIAQVKLLAQRAAGVIVTIEGVDGFIPRSELPESARNLDGFGLLADDWIEGKILRFEKETVILSTKGRLADLHKEDTSASQSPIHYNPTLGAKLEGLYWDLQLKQLEEPRLAPIVRERLRRILVVEDNHNVSASLKMVLDHFGLSCEAIGTLQEAQERLAAESYDLVLLDVNLPQAKGAELLSSVDPEVTQVYVLTAAKQENWDQVLDGQETRVTAFFRKPTPIREIFDHLNQQFGKRPKRSKPKTSSRKPAKAKPEPLSWATLPLEQDRKVKIEETLAHLIRDTDADQAFVLGLQPGPSFTLVAGTFPELTREVQQNLEVSPVGNVIRERSYRLEPDVESKPEVFRHLTSVLPLGSFAGLGLDYKDQAQYGLFLTAREPKKLHGATETRLRMAALQIGACLAEERFDQVITEKQSLLLTGFLADSLLHEIKNEIQALNDFAAIPLLLAKKHRDDLSRMDTQDSTRLKQSVVGIQGVSKHLEDLVRLFRNIAARPHEEPVVLNDAVLRLQKTLQPFAEDHATTVETDLGKDIPELLLNPKLLDQPLLNIMINAIEQMAFTGSSRRILRVVTRHLPGEEYPIQISLSDTGPGIHHVHWEKIFDLFFSTKEQGTGLGLYISRFFIHRLGGRLRLAESVMFSGSTFCIELPEGAMA